MWLSTQMIYLYILYNVYKLKPIHKIQYVALCQQMDIYIYVDTSA